MTAPGVLPDRGSIPTGPTGAQPRSPAPPSGGPDSFESRFGSVSPQPGAPDFSIHRTDLPPARDVSTPPTPTPSTEPSWQEHHNQISGPEMERALADLRASGWSEDRLKAALGDEYVPPAGTASTSGQQQQPSPSGTYEPDLGWQNVPQIKELTPTELADVDAATKDVFELLAVPLDLAASTARTICASADHYDNLPESQRELYTRTEEHLG